LGVGGDNLGGGYRRVGGTLRGKVNSWVETASNVAGLPPFPRPLPPADTALMNQSIPIVVIFSSEGSTFLPIIYGKLVTYMEDGLRLHNWHPCP
jgi:hypothetical protein